MTRRRHFPSIIQTIGGVDAESWRSGIDLVAKMHGDALNVPLDWSKAANFAAVLSSSRLAIAPLHAPVEAARAARLGVFFQINLPATPATQFTHRELLGFQERHLRPLMDLDLAGIIIADGHAWPPESILLLQRLVRLKEGAVLFVAHGRPPDAELLDGHVDGVVDSSAIAGISRFLHGAISGAALSDHLERQQERLGIDLAGRLLNPLDRLAVEEEFEAIGVGLAFAIRGYPMLPAPPLSLPEYVYGTAAQLRRAQPALEWGRFVNLSPPDNPSVIAFGRADERTDQPIIVIARRAAGGPLTLPLRLGALSPDVPFTCLNKTGFSGNPRDGWLDLPSCDGPTLLILGQ
jgi:hypothetical protein